MMLGITMGDSSGVGPEILLKAAAARAIDAPWVVYGDTAVLETCNNRLGFGLELRDVTTPAEYIPGAVNVVDHKLLRAADITPGQLNAASGKAAREYVISAAKAALAGEISAM